MRTSGPFFIMAALALAACSGTDASTLTKADEQFVQSVYDQAVTAPQSLIEHADVDPAFKDLAREVERSSDLLAAESRSVWQDVNRSVESNASAQAIIAQATETLAQHDTKIQAKAWIEAVIKQREALMAAAQNQIDTTTNEDVKAFAEKVKQEQSALLDQLRRELDELSK